MNRWVLFCCMGWASWLYFSGQHKVPNYKVANALFAFCFAIAACVLWGQP